MNNYYKWGMLDIVREYKDKSGSKNFRATKEDKTRNLDRWIDG